MQEVNVDAARGADAGQGEEDGGVSGQGGDAESQINEPEVKVEGVGSGYDETQSPSSARIFFTINTLKMDSERGPMA